MRNYEKISLDCKQSIKALQNFKIALECFKELIDIDNTSNIIFSSVFQLAVIRYAKPFTKAKVSDNKTVILPIKDFKNKENFSIDIHKHLMKLRNTLIAHDDLKEIEPKMLFSIMEITPNGSSKKNHIPVSSLISNKSISYPKDIKTIKMLMTHVESVFQGTLGNLVKYLDEAREFIINNHEEFDALARYKKEHTMNANIPIGGKKFDFPDMSNNEWLNIPDPDYSNLLGGYYFEQLKFNYTYTNSKSVRLKDDFSLELNFENNP